MRVWWFALISIGLFLGCQSPASPRTGTVKRKPKVAKNTLVYMQGGKIRANEKLLEKYNFELLWTLPIHRPISKMYLLGDSLYLYSPKEKALYRVRRTDGTVAWFFVLPSGMVYGPSLWEYSKEEQRLTKIYRSDEIAVLSRDRLFLIDKKFGRELKSFPLGSIAPSTSPAVHKYNVFVCGWDNRVYAFSKDTGGEVWRFLADGDLKAPPLIPPGYLKADLLFVPSADGRVYPLRATKGGLAAEPLRTYGEVLSSPVYLKNWVYVASADTNLYCISMNTGRLRWRFLCEAPLLRSPVAIGTTIFALAEKGFLYALHYHTGRLLWKYPSTKDTVYLTSGEVLTGKVLLTSDPGDSVILETEKGQKQVISQNSVKEIIWGSHKVDPKESVVKILARGAKFVYALNRKREIIALDAKKGFLVWKIPASNVDFFVTNNSYYPPSASPEKRQHMGVIFIGFKNGWIAALREKRF